MINIYRRIRSTTVSHGRCTIQVRLCHPSTTNARPDARRRVVASIRARPMSKLSRVTIRAIMRKRWNNIISILNNTLIQIFNEEASFGFQVSTFWLDIRMMPTVHNASKQAQDHDSQQSVSHLPPWRDHGNNSYSVTILFFLWSLLFYRMFSVYEHKVTSTNTHWRSYLYISSYQQVDSRYIDIGSLTLL